MSSMVTSGPVTTLSGNTIDAVVTDEGISFDGSNVIAADVIASNGVVHLIDQVIVPTSDEPAVTTSPPTEGAMTMEETHDDEHEDEGDHGHAMDEAKGSTDPMSTPSSAAMYGTAVATAAVSAVFAMLV